MMMTVVRAPDVRYETLTSPHGEDGEEHEPWTEEDILRAVIEGVEPDGEELSSFMPRWDLTDREADALLGYLKELSE